MKRWKKTILYPFLWLLVGDDGAIELQWVLGGINYVWN